LKPDLRPTRCPISGVTSARRVFVYDAPPAGEIGFRRAAGEPYYREVWQFDLSNHYVSRHAMRVETDYDQAYVDATYQDSSGIASAFDRIIALPPGKSDNTARFERIRNFAASHLSTTASPRVLDIGAGIGVFPYVVTRAGWSCTAVDPDPRAARHMREKLGITAICADFMNAEGLGRFDIVTLNKVLEHVEHPIEMLRRTLSVLAEDGFVYVELPDGEVAAEAGSGQQEFFVEHLHVFSFASTVILANQAGFDPICVERLREPSTKVTLRAFLTPKRRGV
jgi:SAM-dependent methyltransferase